MSISDKYRFRKFKQKKSKPKKFNVLLDLDECLIQTQEQSYPYDFEDRGGYFTEGPHNIRIINYNKQKLLLFLRPNVVDFLKFLFDNFNVGIWTSSRKEYALAIFNDLKGDNPDIKKENLICFITKIKSNKKIKNSYGRLVKEDIFYDIIKNKKIHLKTYDNISKDLNFLFTNEAYKDKFSKKNTLLIDDSIGHYAVNKGKNVILVNEFKSMIYCDNTLLKIEDWLKKNIISSKKRNIDISKMNLPNYISSDPNNFMNKVNYPYTHEIDDITLNTVNKINKECRKLYTKKKSIKKSIPSKLNSLRKNIKISKQTKTLSKINNKTKKTKKKKLKNT